MPAPSVLNRLLPLALNEIATGTENVSRIKTLYDACPRGTGHGT